MKDMTRRPTHVLSVFLIVRRESGEIFFKSRKNTGCMSGHWALPAGHVERGEQMMDAALRELTEEVGITSSRRYLKLVHVESQVGSDYPRINLYFEVTKWTGEPHNAEVSKSSVAAWLNPMKTRGKRYVPDELVVLKSLAKGGNYTEFDYAEYIDNEKGNEKLKMNNEKLPKQEKKKSVLKSQSQKVESKDATVVDNIGK